MKKLKDALRRSPRVMGALKALAVIVLGCALLAWLRWDGELYKAQQAGRNQTAVSIEKDASKWFEQERSITEFEADARGGLITEVGAGYRYTFVTVKPSTRYHVRAILGLDDLERLFKDAPAKPKIVAVSDPSPAQSAQEKMQAITKVIRPFDIVFIIILVMLARKAMGRSFSVESERPKTKFADVIGAVEAKAVLGEIVSYLRDPAQFEAVGARPPRGVVLTGPPGTGKTLLARAVAAEADASFISVSGTDFTDSFVGVASKNVKRLFETARRSAPCVIFIDELDSIGSRGPGAMAADMENNRTINELLIALDGFAQNVGVIVIGATNYLERIDGALLRDGRFDRTCPLSLPSKDERSQLFHMYLKGVPVAGEVDVSMLARQGAGLSPAAIANVVNKAALRVAHSGGSSVQMEDLAWSLEQQQLGAVSYSVQAALKPNDIRRIAVHEAGHAIAIFVTGVTSIQKVTILPRTFALGATLVDGDERGIRTRSELEDELTMLLAGRCAEELILGDMSTGAANDLERASKIAYDMVTRHGYSELGLFSIGGMPGAHAEQLALKAAGLASVILDQARVRACALLDENRPALTMLADMLLEQETVSGGAVAEVVTVGRRIRQEQLDAPA